MIVNDECKKMTSSRCTMGLSSIRNTAVEALRIHSRTRGTSNTQGYNKFKKNFAVVCELCRCKGHTKDQCYKLIGYPSDFKSKRKLNTRAGNDTYMVGNDDNSARKDEFESMSGCPSFSYGNNTNVSMNNSTGDIYMSVLINFKDVISLEINIVKFVRCSSTTKDMELNPKRQAKNMKLRIILQVKPY